MHALFFFLVVTDFFTASPLLLHTIQSNPPHPPPYPYITSILIVVRATCLPETCAKRLVKIHAIMEGLFAQKWDVYTQFCIPVSVTRITVLFSTPQI